MRILVCGGRDYDDRKALFRALDALLAEVPVELVIHGAARGADTLAGQWAIERNIPVMPFPAKWKTFGNAAGPIRNQEMLDDGKPDGVVVFPGGTGTADMKRKAEKAGLRIWEPYA